LLCPVFILVMLIATSARVELILQQGCMGWRDMVALGRGVLPRPAPWWQRQLRQMEMWSQPNVSAGRESHKPVDCSNIGAGLWNVTCSL
jgi:hypothetical protein